MYDREPVSKSTSFQKSTLSQLHENKLVDELKASVFSGVALYVIAALLILGWVVGFFFIDSGAAINILLILALVSILIKVVQGRNY